MRAQSLIFSTLVIWLAFIVKSHAQTVSPQQCATSVHAILARGEGPGDDLNVLVTVQDLILKQIPGATSIGLPYDHGNSNKELAVYSGTLLMQQYIRDYVASCPNAKIALLGYSMGAVVMMDALCGESSIGIDYVAGIETSYAQNIITAAAYGDETYLPLMPWNTGNCTLGIGQLPRLDPGSCEPFKASLQSYCDYGDSNCCGIYPLDGNAAHHTYVDKYNGNVVDFIQSRLS